MIRKPSLIALVLASAMSQALSQPMPPPSARPRVLSDTAEYCAELAGEARSVMGRRPWVPPGVQMLADQGQQLCLMGHLRPGIVRLKMAIQRLRNVP